MFTRMWLLPVATATLLLSPTHRAVSQSLVDSPLAVRILGVTDTGGTRQEAVALLPRLEEEQRAFRFRLSAAGPFLAPQARTADVLARTQQARSSLRRNMAWGAVIGAAAGTLTGIAVLAMCDSYCENAPGRGLALHIGVGAVLGGSVGALVHYLRD